MRAIRIIAGKGGGTPELIEAPAPTPGPGEVLVQVATSSLNRGELLMAGRVTSGDPRPVGVELAGMITEVGPGVDTWAPGDEVVGHGTGTQAEYAALSADALVRKPASASWVEAGAFLNAYMTAHDALVTNGRMTAGEAVLANAATGGVGLATVQIARALGASTVIATARSAERTDDLLELGADRVIDLSTTDQVRAVAEATADKGVDVIVDSVGGSVLDENLSALAIQGRLVQVGRMGGATATIDLTKLWRKRLHLIGVTFQTRSEAERIACIRAAEHDLFGPWERREIVPAIDRVFPAAAVAEAYAHMAKGGNLGKIVLTFDDRAGASS